MGDKDQVLKNNGKIVVNCFEIQGNFKIPENPDEIAALMVQEELTPRLQTILRSKERWHHSNINTIVKTIYGDNHKIKHTETTDGKKKISFSLDPSLPKSLMAAIIYSHKFYEYYYNTQFVYTAKLEEASIAYRVSVAESANTAAWVSYRSQTTGHHHTCTMHFSKDIDTYNTCKELDAKYGHLFSKHKTENTFLNELYGQTWPQLLNNNQFRHLLHDLFHKSVIANLTHEDEHAFLGANHAGSYQSYQLSDDRNKLYEEVVSSTFYSSGVDHIAPSYLGRWVPRWGTSLLGHLVYTVRYGENKRSFAEATYTVTNLSSYATIDYEIDERNHHHMMFRGTKDTFPAFMLKVEGKRNILDFTITHLNPSADLQKQTGVSAALKVYGSAMILQDGKPISYLGLYNGSQIHEIHLGSKNYDATPSNRIILSHATDKVALTGRQKDTVLYFPDNPHPNFTLETNYSSGVIILYGPIKNLNLKATKNPSKITYCNQGNFHITLPGSNEVFSEETRISVPGSLLHLNINDRHFDLSYKDKASGCLSQKNTKHVVYDCDKKLLPQPTCNPCYDLTQASWSKKWVDLNAVNKSTPETQLFNGR